MKLIDIALPALLLGAPALDVHPHQAPAARTGETQQMATEDPFTGTWRLNLARSTMNPATASKGELIRYRVIGDEEEFVTEATTIKGEPESIRYRARYDDGKAYPFTTTLGTEVRSAETMVKRVDRWTRERFNVRDGKPVIASRRIVSKDGRTLTLTILRVDTQGRETIAETRVFDKQ